MKERYEIDLDEAEGGWLGTVRVEDKLIGSAIGTTFEKCFANVQKVIIAHRNLQAVKPE
jgi:hypothetical protein